MSKSHFLCRNLIFWGQKYHFLGQKSVLSVYALPEEAYLTCMEVSGIPSLQLGVFNTFVPVSFLQIPSLILAPQASFRSKFSGSY